MPQRHELKLIFQLIWSKPICRTNLVCMYDTPNTTGNFETFRDYLVTNSGAFYADVEIVFVSDNGSEHEVNSRASFDIALSAFRLKARLKEAIKLKLEVISMTTVAQEAGTSTNVAALIDGDTQTDDVMAANVPPTWFVTYLEEFKRDLLDEVAQVVSNSSHTNSNAAKKRTKQLKKQRTSQTDLQECVANVASGRATSKLSARSSGGGGGGDPPKSTAYTSDLLFAANRELAKFLKNSNTTPIKQETVASSLPTESIRPDLMHNPLPVSAAGGAFLQCGGGKPHDNWLEDYANNKNSAVAVNGAPPNNHHLGGYNLINPALKQDVFMTENAALCRLKALNAFASDDTEFKVDTDQVSRQPVYMDKFSLTSDHFSLDYASRERLYLLDGDVVTGKCALTPHLIGGENYIHNWNVINTGRVAWTEQTQLRFSWGNDNLVPVRRTASVPCLQPGEKGCISMMFKIPSMPGNYNSHWNFYESGHRFGKSLGFWVTVNSIHTYHSSEEDCTEFPVQNCVEEASPASNCEQYPLFEEFVPITNECCQVEEPATMPPPVVAEASTPPIHHQKNVVCGEQSHIDNGFVLVPTTTPNAYKLTDEEEEMLAIDFYARSNISQMNDVEAPKNASDVSPTVNTPQFSSTPSSSPSFCKISMVDSEEENNMVGDEIAGDEGRKTSPVSERSIDYGFEYVTHPLMGNDASMATLNALHTENFVDVGILNSLPNAIEAQTKTQVPTTTTSSSSSSSFEDANDPQLTAAFGQQQQQQQSGLTVTPVPIEADAQKSRVFVFTQNGTGFEVLYPVNVVGASNQDGPQAIAAIPENCVVVDDTNVNNFELVDTISINSESSQETVFVEDLPNDDGGGEDERNFTVDMAVTIEGNIVSRNENNGEDPMKDIAVSGRTFRSCYPDIGTPNSIEDNVEVTSSVDAVCENHAETNKSQSTDSQSSNTKESPIVRGAVAVDNMFNRVLNGSFLPSQSQLNATDGTPDNVRSMLKLVDMGFYDVELNTRLLERFNNDVNKVANELLNISLY